MNEKSQTPFPSTPVNVNGFELKCTSLGFDKNPHVFEGEGSGVKHVECGATTGIGRGGIKGDENDCTLYELNKRWCVERNVRNE